MGGGCHLRVGRGNFVEVGRLLGRWRYGVGRGSRVGCRGFLVERGMFLVRLGVCRW